MISYAVPRIEAALAMVLAFSAANWYTEVMHSKQDEADVHLSFSEFSSEVLGAGGAGIDEFSTYNTITDLHRFEPETMAEVYRQQSWLVRRNCVKGIAALCDAHRRAVIGGLYNVYTPSYVYEAWVNGMNTQLADALIQDKTIKDAYDNWPNLLPDARVDVLQRISSIHSDVYKADGLDLWRTNIDVMGLPGGRLAEYQGFYWFNDRWGDVRLDRSYVAYASFEENVLVMLHELRHLVQDVLTTKLGTSEGRKYLNDRGVLADVYMLDQSSGALWLKGQVCQNGVVAPNADYFNRPIEQDARLAESIAGKVKAAFAKPITVVAMESDSEFIEFTKPFLGSTSITAEAWTPKADDTRVMPALPPKPKATC